MHDNYQPPTLDLKSFTMSTHPLISVLRSIFNELKNPKDYIRSNGLAHLIALVDEEGDSRLHKAHPLNANNITLFSFIHISLESLLLNRKRTASPSFVSPTSTPSLSGGYVGDQIGGGGRADSSDPLGKEFSDTGVVLSGSGDSRRSCQSFCLNHICGRKTQVPEEKRKVYDATSSRLSCSPISSSYLHLPEEKGAVSHSDINVREDEINDKEGRSSRNFLTSNIIKTTSTTASSPSAIATLGTTVALPPPPPPKPYEKLLNEKKRRKGNWEGEESGKLRAQSDYQQPPSSSPPPPPSLVITTTAEIAPLCSLSTLMMKGHNDLEGGLARPRYFVESYKNAVTKNQEESFSECVEEKERNHDSFGGGSIVEGRKNEGIDDITFESTGEYVGVEDEGIGASEESENVRMIKMGNESIGVNGNYRGVTPFCSTVANARCGLPTNSPLSYRSLQGIKAVDIILSVDYGDAFARMKFMLILLVTAAFEAAIESEIGSEFWHLLNETIGSISIKNNKKVKTKKHTKNISSTSDYLLHSFPSEMCPAVCSFCQSPNSNINDNNDESNPHLAFWFTENPSTKLDENAVIAAASIQVWGRIAKNNDQFVAGLVTEEQTAILQILEQPLVNFGEVWEGGDSGGEGMTAKGYLSQHTMKRTSGCGNENKITEEHPLRKGNNALSFGDDGNNNKIDDNNYNNINNIMLYNSTHNIVTRKLLQCPGCLQEIITHSRRRFVMCLMLNQLLERGAASPSIQPLLNETLIALVNPLVDPSVITRLSANQALKKCLQLIEKNALSSPNSHRVQDNYPRGEKWTGGIADNSAGMIISPGQFDNNNFLEESSTHKDVSLFDYIQQEEEEIIITKTNDIIQTPNVLSYSLIGNDEENLFFPDQGPRLDSQFIEDLLITAIFFLQYIEPSSSFYTLPFSQQETTVIALEEGGSSPISANERVPHLFCSPHSISLPLSSSQPYQQQKRQQNNNQRTLSSSSTAYFVEEVKKKWESSHSPLSFAKACHCGHFYTFPLISVFVNHAGYLVLNSVMEVFSGSSKIHIKPTLIAAAWRHVMVLVRAIVFSGEEMRTICEVVTEEAEKFLKMREEKIKKESNVGDFTLLTRRGMNSKGEDRSNVGTGYDRAVKQSDSDEVIQNNNNNNNNNNKRGEHLCFASSALIPPVIKRELFNTIPLMAVYDKANFVKNCLNDVIAFIVKICCHGIYSQRKSWPFMRFFINYFYGAYIEIKKQQQPKQIGMALSPAAETKGNSLLIASRKPSFIHDSDMISNIDNAITDRNILVNSRVTMPSSMLPRTTPVVLYPACIKRLSHLLPFITSVNDINKFEIANNLYVSVADKNAAFVVLGQLVTGISQILYANIEILVKCIECNLVNTDAVLWGLERKGGNVVGRSCYSFPLKKETDVTNDKNKEKVLEKGTTEDKNVLYSSEGDAHPSESPPPKNKEIMKDHSPSSCTSSLPTLLTQTRATKEKRKSFFTRLLSFRWYDSNNKATPQGPPDKTFSFTAEQSPPRSTKPITAISSFTTESLPSMSPSASTFNISPSSSFFTSASTNINQNEQGQLRSEIFQNEKQIQQFPHDPPLTSLSPYYHQHQVYNHWMRYREADICLARLAKAKPAFVRPYVLRILDAIFEDTKILADYATGGGRPDGLIKPFINSNNNNNITSQSMFNPFVLAAFARNINTFCGCYPELQSTSLEKMLNLAAYHLSQIPLRTSIRSPRDAQDTKALNEIFLALSELVFTGYSTLDFLVNYVSPRFTDPDLSTRKRSTELCVKLMLSGCEGPDSPCKLSSETGATIHRGASHIKLITSLVIKLLGVAISDTELRRNTLSLFSSRFDYILASKDCIHALMPALNDRHENALVAIGLLGRLSKRNPNTIYPILRRILIQCVTEIEFLSDIYMREGNVILTRGEEGGGAAECGSSNAGNGAGSGRRGNGGGAGNGMRDRDRKRRVCSGSVEDRHAVLGGGGGEDAIGSVTAGVGNGGKARTQVLSAGGSLVSINEQKLVEATTILGALVEAAPDIIQHFRSALLASTIRRLIRVSGSSSIIITALLGCVGKLAARVSHHDIPLVRDVTPVIVGHILDGSSTIKRQTALKALTCIIRATNDVYIYEQYPALLQSLLSMLHGGFKESWPVRRDILALMGTIGAVDRVRVKLILRSTQEDEEDDDTFCGRAEDLPVKVLQATMDVMQMTGNTDHITITASHAFVDILISGSIRTTVAVTYLPRAISELCKLIEREPRQKAKHFVFLTRLIGNFKEYVRPFLDDILRIIKRNINPEDPVILQQIIVLLEEMRCCLSEELKLWLPFLLPCLVATLQGAANPTGPSLTEMTPLVSDVMKTIVAPSLFSASQKIGMVNNARAGGGTLALGTAAVGGGSGAIGHSLLHEGGAPTTATLTSLMNINGMNDPYRSYYNSNNIYTNNNINCMNIELIAALNSLDAYKKLHLLKSSMLTEAESVYDQVIILVLEAFEKFGKLIDGNLHIILPFMLEIASRPYMSMPCRLQAVHTIRHFALYLESMSLHCARCVHCLVRVLTQSLRSDTSVTLDNVRSLNTWRENSWEMMNTLIDQRERMDDRNSRGNNPHSCGISHFRFKERNKQSAINSDVLNNNGNVDFFSNVQQPQGASPSPRVTIVTISAFNCSSLHLSAVLALISIAQNLGEDFAKFMPSVRPVIAMRFCEGSHIAYELDNMLAHQIERGTRIVLSEPKKESRIVDVRERIAATMSVVWGNEQYEEQNLISSSLFPVKEGSGQNVNTFFQQTYTRSAAFKSMLDSMNSSGEDDWRLWLSQFTIELLKSSTSPALRVCVRLAQTCEPFTRQVFYPTFALCFLDMSLEMRRFTVQKLNEVLKSEGVSTEVLQELLNLVEYVERVEKFNPMRFQKASIGADLRGNKIGSSFAGTHSFDVFSDHLFDVRLLANRSEFCKLHAKAIHYLESQFFTFTWKLNMQLHSDADQPNEKLPLHSGQELLLVSEHIINLSNLLGQHETAQGILLFIQKHFSMLTGKASEKSKTSVTEGSVGIDRGRGIDGTIGKNKKITAPSGMDNALVKFSSQKQQQHKQISFSSTSPSSCSIQFTPEMYEKLQWWSEALKGYNERLKQNPYSPSDILGILRCLDAIGDYQQLLNSYKIVCKRNLKRAVMSVASPLGARAAWLLRNWEEMNAAAEAIPAEGDANAMAGCFYKAVYAVHCNKFAEADMFIKKCRRRLDIRLSTFVAESFDRAYDLMVQAQLLSELEEVAAAKCNRQLIPLYTALWQRRLLNLAQDPAEWQGLLANHALVLSPHEQLPMWIDFAALCGGEKSRVFMAKEILYKLLGNRDVKEVISAAAAAAARRAATVGMAPSETREWRGSFDILEKEKGGRLMSFTQINTNNTLTHNSGTDNQSTGTVKVRGGVDGGNGEAVSFVVILAAVTSKYEDGEKAEALSLLRIYTDTLDCSRHPHDVATCHALIAEWLTHSDTRYAYNPFLRQEILTSLEKATVLDRQNGQIWQQWARAHHDIVTAITTSSNPKGKEKIHIGRVYGWDGAGSGDKRSPYFHDSNRYKGVNYAGRGGGNEQLRNGSFAMARNFSIEGVGGEPLNNPSFTADNPFKPYPSRMDNRSLFDSSSLDVEQYIYGAINCYVHSIKLSQKLQDVLGFLSLWFSYGNIPQVDELATNSVKQINVDVWLSVLQQIIARIHTPFKAITRGVHRLLDLIAKSHPQALLYPLNANNNLCGSIQTTSSKELKMRQRESQKILERIVYFHKSEGRRVTREAQLICQELNRCAVLWPELWAREIVDANTQWTDDKNVKNVVDSLQPLYNLLNRPATPSEKSFVVEYGAMLKEAQKAMLDAQRGVCDIDRAWKLFEEILKRFDHQISRTTSFIIQFVSPNLVVYGKNTTVMVPGQYSASRQFPRIATFFPDMTVMSSKQHPRRVIIMGDNGIKYRFLLKGHEDLRQDERVMQLFGLVNTLLESHSTTKRRDYLAQLFSITPLGDNAGLVGWVDNCHTLHAMIKEYRSLNRIPTNTEYNIIQNMTGNDTALMPIQALECFEASQEKTDGCDLAVHVWSHAPSAEIWLSRRTTYVRTLASMSMIGHILGLGDRHPSNLMMHSHTGVIVHIDFGDCFEVAMHRALFPEKVPFRLTRMLIKAMEICGIEGFFRHGSESVMMVLRSEKTSLLAMLEAFVHDPVLSWRLEEDKLIAAGLAAKAEEQVSGGMGEGESSNPTANQQQKQKNNNGSDAITSLPVVGNVGCIEMPKREQGKVMEGRTGNSNQDDSVFSLIYHGDSFPIHGNNLQGEGDVIVGQQERDGENLAQSHSLAKALRNPHAPASTIQAYSVLGNNLVGSIREKLFSRTFGTHTVSTRSVRFVSSICIKNGNTMASVVTKATPITSELVAGKSVAMIVHRDNMRAQECIDRVKEKLTGTEFEARGASSWASFAGAIAAAIQAKKAALEREEVYLNRKQEDKIPFIESPNDYNLLKFNSLNTFVNSVNNTNTMNNSGVDVGCVTAADISREAFLLSTLPKSTVTETEIYHPGSYSTQGQGSVEKEGQCGGNAGVFPVNHDFSHKNPIPKSSSSDLEVNSLKVGGGNLYDQLIDTNGQTAPPSAVTSLPYPKTLIKENLAGSAAATKNNNENNNIIISNNNIDKTIINHVNKENVNASEDELDKYLSYIDADSGGIVYDRVALSVPEQVAKLIEEATSSENLCQHYMGWCAHW